MRETRLAISAVAVLQPKVFTDERDFFNEIFSPRQFEHGVGKFVSFVQNNYFISVKNILYFLKYNIQWSRVKLLWFVKGRVCGVIMDPCESRATSVQWIGALISADNKHLLWLLIIFAHVSAMLSKTAEFFCKTTDYFAPQHERGILWGGVYTGGHWSKNIQPILSAMNAQGIPFKQAELYV